MAIREISILCGETEATEVTEAAETFNQLIQRDLILVIIKSNKK